MLAWYSTLKSLISSRVVIILYIARYCPHLMINSAPTMTFEAAKGHNSSLLSTLHAILVTHFELPITRDRASVCTTTTDISDVDVVRLDALVISLAFN